MAKKENELKNVAVRLVEQPSFLSDEKIDSPQAACAWKRIKRLTDVKFFSFEE